MFCSKCGTENKETSKFCESCGAPLNHSPNAQSSAQQVPKNNSSSGNAKKVVIIGLTALICVGMVVGFLLMNQDSIDVTEVSVPDSNTIKYIGTYDHSDKSHDPFTETIQVTFKAKDDIKDVMHIKLDNIVLTFDDNTTADMGSIESSGYDKSLNDNNYLDRDNAIYKNAIYAINFETTMDTGNNDNNKYKIATMKHIKADVLVDTNSQENKVIGHLDNDIVWYDDNRNKYLESLKNNDTSENNENSNNQNENNNANTDNNDNNVAVTDAKANSNNIKILSGKFNTGHKLSDKTYCDVYVGEEFAGTNLKIQIWYSRDGSTLNPGNIVPKTVKSNGYVSLRSANAFKYYPDHASITLYDTAGNILDTKEVEMSASSGTQTF